jgi:hypothetical protein
MNPPKIVLRINTANPNHHLWNNNATWWCHYTEHRPDFTKQRIRASLGTKAVAEARLRRDQLLVLRPEDSLVSASMTLIPNKIATQTTEW